MSAAIEQVQQHKLTFVQWIFVENDSRSQDTVGRHLLKFMEAGVFLFIKNKRKILENQECNR